MVLCEKSISEFSSNLNVYPWFRKNGFLQNVFVKIKNSIFLPKYMRYKKNVSDDDVFTNNLISAPSKKINKKQKTSLDESFRLKVNAHWENSFFDIRSKKKFPWIEESFIDSKKLFSI